MTDSKKVAEKVTDKKVAEKVTDKKVAEKVTDKKIKKLGVILSILEIIKKSKKPITKETIVKELKKRFPERAEKSMLTTVLVQIGGKKQPTRLEREKKVKLFINIVEKVKYFSI